MKKGRHRRFEEARKLKQAGPAAFGVASRDDGVGSSPSEDDDEYAAIAKKYGVTFDEDDDDEDDH